MVEQVHQATIGGVPQTNNRLLNDLLVGGELLNVADELIGFLTDSRRGGTEDVAEQLYEVSELG